MKKLYFPFLTGHEYNDENLMSIRIEPANKKFLLDSVIVNVNDQTTQFPQGKKAERTVIVKKIVGGEVIDKKGDLVQIARGSCEIQLQRKPLHFHPMSIVGTAPKDARPGTQYIYHIKQLNAQRQLVGGITVIFEKSSKKKKEELKD